MLMYVNKDQVTSISHLDIMSNLSKIRKGQTASDHCEVPTSCFCFTGYVTVQPAHAICHCHVPKSPFSPISIDALGG